MRVLEATATAFPFSLIVGPRKSRQVAKIKMRNCISVGRGRRVPDSPDRAKRAINRMEAGGEGRGQRPKRGSVGTASVRRLRLKGSASREKGRSASAETSEGGVTVGAAPIIF